MLDSQHLYMMEEELVEAEGRVEKLKWDIRAWKRVMKTACNIKEAASDNDSQDTATLVSDREAGKLL